jgi:pilus assembly protein FimV
MQEAGTCMTGDALKTDMKKRTPQWALREIAAVAAVAAALTAAPSAWALGLGRLSVQSALGEALRAEIDVTSLTPEEGSNLRVAVAPPDSYRVAGIDYNAVLPATEVSLQRRADGTPYLRIVSSRTVQEPFVDLILELSWPSGKLLREYTLLFDPPSAKVPAAAPTAPVVTAPAPAPRAPVAAPAPVAPALTAAPVAPAPSAPVKAAASDVPAAAVPAPRPPLAVAETSGSNGDAGSPYQVRGGDTLSGIARKLAPEGVSLDQMLVSLYQNNGKAFVGNNMNRLRSGVVLNVPTAEQAAGVDRREARRVILAQSADFDAYRRRLAGAVAAQDKPEATRSDAGKVQTEVQDKKQAATPAPDRLTLDKGKGNVPGASAPEDKLARQRADKEAANRVAELSRNLDELKSTGGSAASAVGVPGRVAPAPAVVASAPAPVASAPAPAPVVAASVPVAAASMAEAASAAASEVVAAASEAASANVMAASEPASEVALAASAAASAPAVAPVVASDEPSLIDTLAENPLVLPGAGVILAILAGLGWYRWRNKNKDEAGVTSFLESRLQPDSFFGASGGQRVDTRDANGTPSSMSYSLSQIDAIGDVDPVAEADVYLAYGRDLQAEEILKEAMRATPERLAIRTKLLEVYAKRRDTKGFELLAGELYGLTGGQGEEWSKAQELGRSIDPENPLYEPGGVPTAHSGLGDTGMEPLGASTMPQSVVPSPSRFLDSGGDDLMGESLSGVSGAVDLDISVPAAIDDSALAPSGFAVDSIPDVSIPDAFNASQPASAPASFDTDSHSLDFDLQDLPSVEPAASEPAPPTFDLSGISLDLDAPLSAPASGLGDMASAPLDLPLEDDGTDPLERKLELAEEFRQIGDLEGARDLLQEVVDKSDGTLKAKAQGMLDNLS